MFKDISYGRVCFIIMMMQEEELDIINNLKNYKMRTKTQKINAKAKKTAIGVVIVLNVSLGLETSSREIKLKGREELSEVEAETIARKKYSSILNAGGRINISSIEKYHPIEIGIKGVLKGLRMYQ